MIQSLALDALLLLILVLLVPIGMYRGGLREIGGAAGLLLAYLVAVAWSPRWGTWLAHHSSMNEGIARFSVAVLTLVLIAGVIGYGAAAAFSYHPGPGGRLYGGLIALFSGLLFLAAVIQFVRDDLHDGGLPALIRDSYLARVLATGFDNVLLVVTIVSLLATAFGTLVRERSTEEFAPVVSPIATAPRRSPSTPQRLSMAEPKPADAVQTLPDPPATLHVREIRHWEDPSPPTAADLQVGWNETWPAVDRATPISGRDRSGRGQRGVVHPDRSPAQSHDDVLRTWLEEEQRDNEKKASRRSRVDE